jgi:signal transduction histidine kinase
MRLRPTLRLRLTALYTALFLAAGALLLGVSYLLLKNHLGRTLPDAVAGDILSAVREQYALALLGVTMLATLLGWLMAGRALAPLRGIAAAARGVSGNSLDRRIEPRGPDDEVRELAQTLDGMLSRLDAAFAGQRRFVANASHELRTPLTVMRTELEVALSDPDANADDLRRAAQVVGDEVVRCQALIDSLLLLARSEAEVIHRDERSDLSQLARSVAARLRRLAQQRGVKLTVRAEPAVVAGEGRLLEEALRNLAENALLYNSSGGFATVEVRVAGRDAVVRVENSGPVVPPEAAASLLEPFQRLDRGGAGGPGAGVGLSIVRAVVRAHGGSLRLESRREGGLRIELRLPAVATSANEPTGPDAGPRGSRARLRGDDRPGARPAPNAARR